MAAALPLVMGMTIPPQGVSTHRPRRSAGDRMIDCPFYGECLRFAMDAGWRAWNCGACEMYSPEEPLMSACGTVRPRKPVVKAPVLAPKTKACIWCGRELEVNSDNFQPYQKAEDGFGNTCKLCIQARGRLSRRKKVILNLAERRPLLQRLADDARACNDTIEKHTIWIIETYFKALEGQDVAPRGGR